MTENDTVSSFPAHVRADCVVLVLGSMPGVASLQQAQYYAHPRNRFWPLMHALLGVPAGADYPARLHALAQAGVGLWDVIGQCRRRGSLDADIVRGSEVANPLPELIATLPQLRLVACNGAAAFQAFQRLIVPQLAVPRTRCHCRPPVRPMPPSPCPGCARHGSRWPRPWRRRTDCAGQYATGWSALRGCCIAVARPAATLCPGTAPM